MLHVAACWNPVRRRRGSVAASPAAIAAAAIAAIAAVIAIRIALAAAGAYDPGTLESPIGRPFIILGLTYAALTPGFSFAAAIVARTSVG